MHRPLHTVAGRMVRDANQNPVVVDGLRRCWEGDDKGGSLRTVVENEEYRQRLYDVYSQERGVEDVVDAGEECHWGSG